MLMTKTKLARLPKVWNYNEISRLCADLLTTLLPSTHTAHSSVPPVYRASIFNRPEKLLDKASLCSIHGMQRVSSFSGNRGRGQFGLYQARTEVSLFPGSPVVINPHKTLWYRTNQEKFHHEAMANKITSEVRKERRRKRGTGPNERAKSIDQPVALPRSICRGLARVK